MSRSAIAFEGEVGLRSGLGWGDEEVVDHRGDRSDSPFRGRRSVRASPDLPMRFPKAHQKGFGLWVNQ